MIKNKIVNIRKHSSIASEVIHKLMLETGIKESELARQTGLPQTTINRLLIGATSDPRTNTLKPIANFFGVTIGQLVGEEPINKNRVPGTFVPNNREAWSHVPIISWDEVVSWIFRKDNYNIHSHKEWIATERPISNTSFAVISKQFMEPRFRKNSILITDPNAEHQDGKFVVVSLDGNTVTVRQLVFDGSECYLKNLDSTMPTIKLDKNKHQIVGVIVESRVDES